jgi:hypothetical protein
LISAETVQVSSISQYGITWTFDKQYTSGKFVNGDYWVLGPIQITSITPSPNTERNGTMVNPIAADKQSFDSRAPDWNANAGVTTFPLAINADSSVVSSISRTDCVSNCRPAVDVIAVLTVLMSKPANDGVTIFRPSYAGATKSLWSASDLHTEKLAVFPLPSSKNIPTLSQVADTFSKPWVDYMTSWSGGYIHPLQTMPNYGGDMVMQINEAALRLLLNDTLEEKMPALINYLQFGVDLFGCISSGTQFPADGGHALGRLVPLAYASILLTGGESMLPIINSTSFGEFESVVRGKDGQALWGQITRISESNYWINQMNRTGARTSPDPYGYIDGGETPGGSYQSINAPNFKATALVAYMFPEAQLVVNRAIFYEFVERFVGNGTWTQPDPCAGFDGNYSNFRITFGPDGNGGCILDKDPSDGIGRYPQLHFSDANRGSGSYTSAFCEDMWTNFRSQLAGFGSYTPLDNGSPTSNNNNSPNNSPNSPSGSVTSLTSYVTACWSLIGALLLFL